MTSSAKAAVKQALRVQDNLDRSRPALPSHLQRLLIHSFNGSERARFPSRVHTFACLAYFHQQYGPLIDAHVHNDIETNRPDRRIEVILSQAKAAAALERAEHRIFLPNNGAHLNPRAFDEAAEYQTKLRDVVGPFAEEGEYSEQTSSFTVALRSMEEGENATLDPHWHDRWERMAFYPRTREKTERDPVNKLFAAFAGFVNKPKPKATKVAATEKS